MKCFLCKDNMTAATTTYMTTYNNCYIIIKNVPCLKCNQCGDAVFLGSVAEKIDDILDRAEKIISKISIIDYTKVA